MDCSLPGLLCPWNSLGKNIGVESHSLLQGIFLAQGSNSSLLHCMQILYCLSHLLISPASKVVLKILQARLQQYMNWELPDIQAGFRKNRGTRDQIANIHWIIEKARELKKKNSASLITLKPLTLWITTNCEKFLKRGNTRPSYLSSEKPIHGLRSNS